MASKKTAYATGNGKRNGNGTANLGFEQKLWLAADKLRGNMDASEYKHVILGLIFLKYISDSFESRRQWLVRESADPKSEYHVKNEAQRAKVAEDRDEYLAENVFWVPPKARWANCRTTPSNRPSANSLTTRWTPSSGRTRRSRASCRRTTPAPTSTRPASAN